MRFDIIKICPTCYTSDVRDSLWIPFEDVMVFRDRYGVDLHSLDHKSIGDSLECLGQWLAKVTPLDTGRGVLPYLEGLHQLAQDWGERHKELQWRVMS